MQLLATHTKWQDAAMKGQDRIVLLKIIDDILDDKAGAIIQPMLQARGKNKGTTVKYVAQVVERRRKDLQAQCEEKESSRWSLKDGKKRKEKQTAEATCKLKTYR